MLVGPSGAGNWPRHERCCGCTSLGLRSSTPTQRPSLSGNRSVRRHHRGTVAILALDPLTFHPDLVDLA
jgi:hypothetical protein